VAPTWWLFRTEFVTAYRSLAHWRREGFLSAYPWRYAFDATIGAREPRGRKWYARYYESAISLSSPEFDSVRAIAVDNKVFLSVGIIEKADTGGATLYCTSVLIGQDGTLLSSHRKVLRRIIISAELG
jgi:predicted amidohydrolase